MSHARCARAHRVHREKAFILFGDCFLADPSSCASVAKSVSPSVESLK
jgi:hypothetical protein